MPVRLLILSLALAFVHPAAGAETLGLEQARALWRAAGVAAYRYEYRKFCECHPTDPATTVVTVRGARIEEVRYRYANGEPDVVLAPDRISWYWTIEGLFALIESGRDNPSLRVTYDSDRGYPLTVYLDPDTSIEGDEIDVRVSGLTPLTP
jgi:Family of unknown function (DUF6174)